MTYNDVADRFIKLSANMLKEIVSTCTEQCFDAQFELTPLRSYLDVKITEPGSQSLTLIRNCVAVAQIKEQLNQAQTLFTYLNDYLNCASDEDFKPFFQARKMLPSLLDECDKVLELYKMRLGEFCLTGLEFEADAQLAERELELEQAGLDPDFDPEDREEDDLKFFEIDPKDAANH